MTDGEKMLRLAETRIGEKYVNVLVPKNNKNWHGPWDCAEFMCWFVYQVGGVLYGCVDDKADPATVEAYTGAWQTDSQKLGKRVPKAQAAATVGAILLRYPPAPGAMGHIVVSDGKGGTVEAMGKAYGVRRGKVSGRVSGGRGRSSAQPPFGHLPRYAMPCSMARSSAARSTPVWPPDTMVSMGQPARSTPMTSEAR
jgi:hypothetical protein